MKVLVTMGTRPEAIKMAPVVLALQARPDIFEVRVCLTGQHRELLDQVIAVFGLPVHHDLQVMRPDQSIHDVTAAVLQGMRGVLEAEQPGVVLVHGDTTTTFAAALAAYYARIAVGHVEAGLRTYRRYEPFPEELNRRMADVLADYHYAATEQARENLLREGVDAGGIVVTGNTVIDALLDVSARPYAFGDAALDSLGRERRLILVTAHRRESFGAPFESICTALRALADRGDVDLIYPVHPNPNVRRTVEARLSGVPHLHLVEPLEYLPFVHLLKKAALVLTDSGGLQEEAPALGKPVLVMRDVTERPEAIAAGTARLVGTNADIIVAESNRLLDDAAAYAAMARAVNPFGDGRAAARIADHLASVASHR
ncbi:MAG: UDP-N-acetylglucosamine 2-epimerase (non-hydrolyzing) [Candidatus Hydrogenedens sp.]|nr:UDP-N-acetylglucosamine 2-epimerase (non-hydrolyzing) [Candidatus Hydrogenedens sp.]